MAENKPDYITEEGIVFSHDRKVLKKYPKDIKSEDYEITDGVRYIGSEAFFKIQINT